MQQPYKYSYQDYARHGIAEHGYEFQWISNRCIWNDITQAAAIRVSWTERKSHKCLIARENWNRIASVRRGQEKKVFLHILRKAGCRLEKEIIQGTTSGRRNRRRQGTRWEDKIAKLTGLNGDLLLSLAEDRSRWRRIVHETADHRIKDS